MLEELKRQVWQANVKLNRSGLAALTWGNASGIDRKHGMVVIKPSGVEYDALSPDNMVVLDLDGQVVEGRCRPSSDAPTHLILYNAFSAIGGITHTHSTYAVIFAQAGRSIPCFGTTHADHFYGEIPLTRPLGRTETETDYEVNTGKVIVERFGGLDPVAMPGVLVHGHGPFAWGDDAAESVRNAIILEEVAKMAIGSLLLNPELTAIPQHLLDKHFRRKHGPNAYYGQAGEH